MNLVFMGTPEFALPALDAIQASSHQLLACVTVPDKPRGRGLHLIPSPVKRWALDHSLPVLQPASLKDPDFVSTLDAFKADCFVIVAFRILPREVFTLPTRGSFNLHASLLPKYRGAAPINWALMNGETETGVTTFFLQEKVDTGSILLQRSLPIREDMTAGELHDTLALLGADTILATLEGISSGSLVPMAQNDALATPAPKIFRDQCRIDWSRSATDLHNFVRGLSPTPSAWTTLQGEILRIQRVRKTDRASRTAGYLEADGECLFVHTGAGVLEILDLQREGRRAMDAASFLRGFRDVKGLVVE